MSKTFEFERAPGHLVRRAHQLSVAIFAQETATFDITPVQFSILSALIDEPGADQVTVARRVAFDAATSGAVIGRLESRGLVLREADPEDRRRKLLWITDEGRQVLRAMRRPVMRVQDRLLANLSGSEREQFMELLTRVIGNDDVVLPEP
ncbi:MAG: MarR family transcriptional regulator [Burkholderiales bacterium]|jgi:DNA-binding MarR family transcriptional regulator|nr:MarR family transcriptional regulator [Burkholderiales bacterium]